MTPPDMPAQMRSADYARLVTLAAIWGASFMFMRVAAPALGPALTAHARLLLGGLALLAWMRLAGIDAGLARHWRAYLCIGVINSAIPYLFYAFAAMHAPASLLSIINATSPMFGLLFGALFLGERVNKARIAGLILGTAGVALIARPGAAAADPMLIWAIAAALMACAAYGLTGVVMKRWAADAPARGVAMGSQLAAALVLIPLLPILPPPGPITPVVAACVLGLGLLASGIALMLYYRLVVDVGAMRALTVTYLVPLFGVLFGALLLGESLPASALAGGILIVSGTVLVTRS